MNKIFWINRLKVSFNLIIAFSIGIFVFVNVGCKKDLENLTLNIPVENDIQTLDPSTLSDPYTSRIVWQMYDGLLGLDESNKPVPLIAESFSSNNDNTEWTFKIRKNVFFHKSEIFKTADSTRQVNAFDVLESYKKFAKGIGSFVFSGLVKGFDDYVKDKSGSIAGFSVSDSLTFKIILVKPDPSFIYRLTSNYFCIMPSELLINSNKSSTNFTPVGTGPFILVKKTETEVYLTRNLNYWNKSTGNVNNIVFRVEKNQQLRTTQFKNHNYNLMQIPLSASPEFFNNSQLKNEFANDYSYYFKVTFNTHYMGINCEAIKDVNLRKAIGYAIDKNLIVENLLFDQAKVASSPIVPGIQDYNPPQGLLFSIDSAKVTLSKSNYKGETLKIYVSDMPNSEQIGLIIQSDLKKAGINTEIIKLDFNTLISRIFSKERPDMFVMFSEYIYSAPDLLIDSYNSKLFPNPNLYAYKNKEVDSLINLIPSLKTRIEINSICYNVESVASQEVPVVWLFHQKNIFLMDKNLKNFTVNSHNLWNLKDVILE